jgi:hypothetical protein
MIIITSCQRVGTLMQGCDVFRPTAFQMLPIARHTSHLSSQQSDDEQRYIQLLDDHLKQNGFYYSNTYNITLSVQKQAGSNNSSWRNVKLYFVYMQRERERSDMNWIRQIQDFFGTDI